MSNSKPPTTNQKLNLFWFRRDLRLDDNAALFHALSAGLPLIPIFIFDKNILDELDDKTDRRVSFIHQAIALLQSQLKNIQSTLDVRYGFPPDCMRDLIREYDIHTVFTNHDYEPYAIKRDEEIKNLLQQKNIHFKTFKDQVIFERNEIVKDDGQPYAVFTPYSKKWLTQLRGSVIKTYESTSLQKNFCPQKPKPIPSLAAMGFTKTNVEVADIDTNLISQYHNTRDIFSLPTSRLGVHLRFGTISVRSLVNKALQLNQTYLNELIWREFFMQLLWHHPRLVNEACKKEYDKIRWRNNETEFERWCSGQTGYPIVDAGMRELNTTGFMHNRARMITASFLVKHLLIDWRWGEAYFAKKLLDYELASNNGNWQWVAGCGCDAAPWFRIFNPAIQTKKFDPQLHYIKKWVPELDSFSYPQPIIEHTRARQRCLEVYRKAASS